MKEAVGELNMTVITVVALAAVAALVYFFVWPAMEANLMRSTRCAAAYGCVAGDDGMMNCKYMEDVDENGNGTELDIRCPNQSEAAGGTTAP